MRAPRRTAASLLALLACSASLAACGKPEHDAIRQLRAAEARTARLSHRFVYDEVTNDDHKTRVQGLVEDDFRYQALLSLDGKQTLEETVYDDTLADRFIEPAAIPRFVRKQAAKPQGDRPEGDSSPAEVQTSLLARQPVIDRTGAPALVFSAGQERHIVGDDPIFDAQTVFGYIDEVARTMPVVKFDPNSLSYKPKEDPFPKPTKGSGVTRYDFIRLPVPRPSNAGGGNQAVPSEANFRKMVVYVKKGLVFQVLENMDVASRLDDIERNYDIHLDGTTQERVKQAVDAINVVRRGQGQSDPIRVRTMSLRLSNIGEPLKVDRPTDGTFGSLGFLINRGKVLSTGDNTPGATAADSGAASTTTTTAAPAAP